METDNQLELKDLVSICTECGKVRSNAVWRVVSKKERHNLVLWLTHGLCPACAKNLWASARASALTKRNRCETVA